MPIFILLLTTENIFISVRQWVNFACSQLQQTLGNDSMNSRKIFLAWWILCMSFFSSFVSGCAGRSGYTYRTCFRFWMRGLYFISLMPHALDFIKGSNKIKCYEGPRRWRPHLYHFLFPLGEFKHEGYWITLWHGLGTLGIAGPGA